MGSRRTCVSFSLLHEHRRPLIANIKAFSAVTAAAADVDDDDAQTRAAQRSIRMSVAHDFMNFLVRRNDTTENRKNKSIFGVGSKRKRNEFIMIDRLRPYTRNTSSHHIAF